MDDGKEANGTNPRDGKGSLFDVGEEGWPRPSESLNGKAPERDRAESSEETLEESGGRLRRKKGWGFIYFVETENREYMKIGFSVQPELRLHGLATNCPFRLRLLGFMPGNHATERQIHKRFGEDRMNGEWFRNSDQLRTFIRGMGLITPESLASSADEWQPPEELEMVGCQPDADTDPEEPQEYSAMMKEFFLTWGKRSSKARMAKLTPEQRSAIARKGGLAGGRGRKRHEP